MSASAAAGGAGPRAREGAAAGDEALAAPRGADADIDDAAWAQQLRASMALADATLARRFDRGGDTERLVVRRARAADHCLKRAWSRCIPAAAPLSLFAVGGYGRGQLFPRSDLDVLVMAEADAQQRHQAQLARLFALLWDAGFPLGHAVRSAEQCAAAAASDQTVMTALIEARPIVAGPAEIAALEDAVSPVRSWPPRDFFVAKRDEMRARQARHGDIAENLEPNIKDGPGGLRDLHTLGWMALRAFGVRDLQALIGLGHLGPDEAAALRREGRTLARLRFGLHLVAGRPEDCLRFDHQKALAGRLGFADDEETLGVEKMMQGFYRSAAIVRRISDRLLQRFEEHFDGEALPEPLDARFALHRGYLAARDLAWPRNDPRQVFALFAIWALHPEIRGLHSMTARALAEALPRLPAYPQADATGREAFMQLLRAPGAVDSLTRMARLGVLGQWLPAFAQVSGRMQFDLFHTYTVDQHTLMVLRNIAALGSGRADPRFSIAHEVFPRLRKPELLLLAGLFHDIAKGRGGDHSELGTVDALAFCAAHGLGDADGELVAWLVLHHLRMSVTAQKQDVSDPDVVQAFAALVGDRERLDHLYLLTCADIAGTSPKLWNAWKDRLLADLYFATRKVLREGLEAPIRVEQRLEEARAATRPLLAQAGHGEEAVTALLAAIPAESFLRSRPEQVAWQAGVLDGMGAGETRVGVRRIVDNTSALEVFVCSPDRDGLFAAILATLDRLGYSVHQARVLMGNQGTVFDTFEVLPSGGFDACDPEVLARSLRETLAGSLQGVRVARRAVPRQLRHFRFAPKIEFGTTADGQRSILALTCPDRPGLLADLAQVLRAHGVRVHDARIATFGERAEDLFQITDENDRPLDAAAQETLRGALHASLEGQS